MDFEKLSADLQTHPITGVLWTGESLNIPLISQVTENLYVGGCMNGVDLGDSFDHIFSMYPWERYKFGENTKLTETKMYDSDAGVDVEAVERVSDAVVALLLHDKNVLVHCQAGINRSNLVAARVLMKMTLMSGKDAIRVLEGARSPLILANQTFKNYILSFDHKETNG